MIHVDMKLHVEVKLCQIGAQHDPQYFRAQHDPQYFLLLQ